MAAIIMIVLLGLLIREHNLRWEAERRVTYFEPDDRPFIDRAIDLWAVENKQPKQEILTRRFPIVVLFRNETCVVLSLKLYAAAGGDPIYCFDPQSMALTRVDLSHAQ
jgi:hypothetical protein